MSNRRRVRRALEDHYLVTDVGRACYDLGTGRVARDLGEEAERVLAAALLEALRDGDALNRALIATLEERGRATVDSLLEAMRYLAAAGLLTPTGPRLADDLTPDEVERLAIDLVLEDRPR